MDFTSKFPNPNDHNGKGCVYMKQQVQSPAGGFVSHANICIWWVEVVEFSLIDTKNTAGQFQAKQ